jgi:hypothetical protein
VKNWEDYLKGTKKVIMLKMLKTCNYYGCDSTTNFKVHCSHKGSYISSGKHFVPWTLVLAIKAKAKTNWLGKVVHTTIALENCCNTTQSKEGGRHPCKAYFDDCGLIPKELHTKQSIFWYHKCNFAGGDLLSLV